MIEASPSVSVIMPCFNAERYIAEAIHSVLNQSFTDWELILVEDASTDRTAAVIQSFNDPRIIYQPLTEAVHHPAGVRNIGVSLAHGKYLAFLDADDVYNATALETLYATLTANPSAFAAYGFASNMDANGNSVGGDGMLVRDNKGSLALPPGYSHAWRNLLACDLSCLLPALMIERQTFEHLGRFDERCFSVDDFQFYLRMFFHDAAGVICVPAYIYRYRLHASSLTKTEEHTSRILASSLAVVNWVLEQPGLPENVRRLRSYAYTRRYHYLARERLMQGRTVSCRAIVRAGWNDGNVAKIDWIRWCLQLFLRSFLPVSIDALLIQCRRWIRYRGFCVSPKKG